MATPHLRRGASRQQLTVCKIGGDRPDVGRIWPHKWIGRAPTLPAGFPHLWVFICLGFRQGLGHPGSQTQAAAALKCEIKLVDACRMKM
jgi:hypothetical protein